MCSRSDLVPRTDHAVAVSENNIESSEPWSDWLNGQVPIHFSQSCSAERRNQSCSQKSFKEDNSPSRASPVPSCHMSGSSNAVLTMYDMYHLLYPDYFRRVMQLPQGSQFAPPWKLGMHTDWSLSSPSGADELARCDVQRDETTTDVPRLASCHASPASKRKRSHDGFHWTSEYTGDTTAPSESSCDVVTTAATPPVAAAREPEVPSQGGSQDTVRPRGATPCINASGATPVLRKRAQKSSKVTSLSLHVLRELEKQYEGVHDFLSPGEATSCPVTTNLYNSDAETPLCIGAANSDAHGCRADSGSAFLLRVKSEVAARQNTSQGRRRHLGAVERAELQYARGALLSDTTSDSQGSLSSSSHRVSSRLGRFDDRTSVRSDDATVAGRINPDRARAALKAKLKREHHSKADIEFEIACRLAPHDVRREHRRRRQRRNAVVLRECQQMQAARTSGTNIWKLESVAQSQGNCNIVQKTKICEASVDTGGLDAMAATPPADDAPLANVASSGLGGGRRTYSHDEKVLARQRQKKITRAFTELQKQRDRGLLSVTVFERQKMELFAHMFEWTDGRVALKRSEDAAAEFIAPSGKKRIPDPFCSAALKRSRHLEFGNTSDCVTGDEKELKEEEDGLSRFQVTCDDEEDKSKCGGPASKTVQLDDVDDDDDDDITYAACNLNLQRWLVRRSAEGGGFSVDIKDSLSLWRSVPSLDVAAAWKEEVRRDPVARRIYGPSVAEKERQRRAQKGERRQMLMRQFDQRAPPHERMFKQDTSFRSDGKPTAEQRQNWELWWNVPAEVLPQWMRGGANTMDRQLIFPGDRRKM